MAWLRSRPPGRSTSWQRSKYTPQLPEPDVLEHADRADGVVRAVVDVAVVLVPHLDLAREAGLGGALLGQLGLPLREGDAHRVDAVVLGGVQEHAAPSATDVEEAHARFEAELAGDSSCLSTWASSRVFDGSVHTAHEYVIDGPSTWR